jgi:hypothetical protein
MHTKQICKGLKANAMKVLAGIKVEKLGTGIASWLLTPVQELFQRYTHPQLAVE